MHQLLGNGKPPFRPRTYLYNMLAPTGTPETFNGLLKRMRRYAINVVRSVGL